MAHSTATVALPQSLPPIGGYWPRAPLAAIAVLAVVALRLHEVVPLVGRLHPAMLTMAVGLWLSWTNASVRVHESILRDRVLQLGIIYFVWAAATAPFALWAGGAVEALEKLIPALSLILILLLCQPTRTVMDRIHIWVVLAVTILAVLAKLGGQSTAGRLEAGGSLDPNDLAAVMAMFLPFALSLVRHKRAAVKLLGMGSAATLTVVVISTSSRGGALALVVAVAVYALGFRGTRMLLAAGLLAIGGAVAWQTAPAEFRDRLTSIGEETDYNYTAFSGRKQIWARARLYIQERPLKGVGIGNFGVREGQYCKEVLNRGCKWSTTHNAYLQAGAELGVPGLSMFVGLLMLLALKARPVWRVPRREPGEPPAIHQPELLASVAAFAAAAYFLSLAYFYCLFALAGLIAFAHRVHVTEAAHEGASLHAGIQAYQPVHYSGWRSARTRRGYSGSALPVASDGSHQP